jgi:hypothetical protein
LAFQPVSGTNGSATITVTVTDNGVTGGDNDNVVSKTFVVTVTSINDEPTLADLSDVTIAEGASSQTVSLSGIADGDADLTQALSVTATSSDTSLIPDPTVSYTSDSATGSLAF